MVHLPPRAQPIKVDVTVADLVPTSQVSPALFDELERLLRVSQAIDEINRRWGPSTIYFGPMHHCRQPMDNKIAFGRIPNESD